LLLGVIILFSNIGIIAPNFLRSIPLVSSYTYADLSATRGTFVKKSSSVLEKF